MLRFRPSEREAYQQVRVLLAVVYTMTRQRERRAELTSSLRHAALAALTHLFDSAAQNDRQQHVASLHHSVVALDQLSRLVEAGRTQGALPDRCAGELLAVQTRASAALDRALDDWAHLEA